MSLVIFYKNMYCPSYVHRYLRHRCTGLLLNLFIEVLLTHVPIHLRILIQGDGVGCLIDMYRIKDLDRALISQFVTNHGLNPMCKDCTKKMY
jgi:hypothetical protein